MNRSLKNPRLWAVGFLAVVGSAQMMGDLTAAIFDADLSTSVNTFRQNLQLEYVERLGKTMTAGTYDNISESAALYQLKNIEKKVKYARSPDASTKAHRAHVLHKIDDILDRD